MNTRKLSKRNSSRARNRAKIRDNIKIFKQFGWQLLAWIIVYTPIGKWIAAYALKHPFSHLDGYMERYWVFNPFMKRGVVKSRKYMWAPSIRLHHILRADIERDPHDHPWNSRRIILRGRYDEVHLHFDGPEWINTREYLTKHHCPEGHTSPLLFGQYHKIERISEGGVWTLFFMWDYQDNWGFWQNGKKVPHYEYLGKEPPKKPSEMSMRELMENVDPQD